MACELKPCPFCGGKNPEVIRIWEDGEIGSKISCPDCNVSFFHEEADCAEDNIIAWNRRAGE